MLDRVRIGKLTTRQKERLDIQDVEAQLGWLEEYREELEIWTQLCEVGQASTANCIWLPTKRFFFAGSLKHPVDDVKNALPRFDEESNLAHQTKEEQCQARQPVFR